MYARSNSPPTSPQKFPLSSPPSSLRQQGLVSHKPSSASCCFICKSASPQHPCHHCHCHPLVRSVLDHSNSSQRYRMEPHHCREHSTTAPQPSAGGIYTPLADTWHWLLPAVLPSVSFLLVSTFLRRLYNLRGRSWRVSATGALNLIIRRIPLDLQCTSS